MFSTSVTRTSLLSLALACGLIGCKAPVDVTIHALGDGDGVVPGAKLEILGKGLKADFDSNGIVKLDTLRFHGRTGFRVSAPGYETAFRSIELKPGSSYDFKMHLRAAPPPHHIKIPAAGETVMVEQGIAKLKIQGGSLVRPDGTEATGDADVLVVPFDPVLRQEPPASMFTDTSKQLMSAGMATITITQGDVALQPKAGMPLEWQMEINPKFLPAASFKNYKMFYVDEKTGLWHQDDTATLKHPRIAAGEKDHWVAQLPHLTVWNADMAFDPTACIEGHVRDAHGNGVSGGQVDGLDVSIGTSVDAGYCNNNCDDYGNCDWCDSSFGTTAYSYTSYISGGFYHIPVPGLTDSFMSWLRPLYGLEVIPMQITLSGVFLPDQELEGAASVGPITATNHGACYNVDFQFCIQAGKSCSPGDRCCNGNSCNDGVCGGGGAPVDMAHAPECHPEGQSCDNITDCCAGLRYCVGNTCRNCLPLGVAGCGSNSDCCGGTCVNGVCDGCSDEGASCGSDGQCCAGRHCVQPDNNQSSQPGIDGLCRDCIPSGHRTCSDSRDCCNGLLCNNGTCASCLSTGNSCGSSADCCSGMCVNGTCQTCVPAGSSCSFGPCCGGLMCAYDNTCRNCQPKGGLCSSGGDCCSGSCEDMTCN